MIKSFATRRTERLFSTGKPIRGVDTGAALRRLAALDAADSLKDISAAEKRRTA